jgi:transcriptional regulator with XRE-family HTH domain
VIKGTEAKLMKQIGNKLKLIRQKKGLTIEHAAAHFKIGIEMLEKIEAGTANYNLKLFVKICKYYEIDLSEVMP